MAANLTLAVDLQDYLFRLQVKITLLELKPGQAVYPLVSGWGIIEIYPMVFFKIRVFL
jgi:hypothetical protein